MLHTKDLSVVNAYDMHLDCAEGNIEEEWKVEITMTLWEFCDNLSEQMLIYKPSHRVYPGDKWICMVFVYNQGKRRKHVRPSADRDEKGTINKYDLRSANHTRKKLVWLCVDMDKFQKNIDLAE